MISAPSSNPLKRTRPLVQPDPPPLPKIKTDIILTVFTHRSLRRRGVDPSPFDDNEALAELGGSVLHKTVSVILFSIRPFLTSIAIAEHRTKILSDQNFMSWVNLYQLRHRLCCSQDVSMHLHTPKEARTLFCAYVGGVVAESESGDELVRNWMDALIRDDRFTVNSIPSVPQPPATTPPSYKRVKSEEVPPQIFFGSQPPASRVFGYSRQQPPHISPAPPAPPRVPPPPLPPMPPMPPIPRPFMSRPDPSQPTMSFLPLFNQVASQRGVHIEYPASCSGPKHAPNWNVQCVVNGIVKGRGEGLSKSMAKEQAARQAYYAMGWT